MKRALLVITSLISALFLMGAKDSKQVIESLGGLEKSLSSWVESMDNLENKIVALEERLTKESQAKEDLLKALASIEKHIADIGERIQKVEKTTTFFTEMPTETLGKTLRFYNEAIAELKKRLEDQQVITAVLEKKYQEAQKPLEPVMKDVADVRKQVTDLSQKVDQQATTIDNVQKNLQSSIVDSVTSTLKEYEKIFMTLAQRIENLEKQAGVTTTAEVAEKKEEESKTKPEGAKEEEVAEAEKETTPTIVPPKTPEEEGFQDIGQGFYVKNVRFEPFGSSATLMGDMKNYSNKDYSIASFTVKVYNSDELLVGSDDFSIKGFKNGELRPFKQIITGVEPKKIASYSISFNKPY
ncbi:MAG TPA: hypothetical protein ACFYD6_06170 [Candidatus Brocadiia bacterium]|nr:hypothetical protein [Planctomycetota bacterium]MDO8094718.1 hypothetical protein [Candidatus Brocadiales bacterium]